MLPGWCCIANRHIGARERRQLIPHVRFQVPFLGPESQLKSGFACAGLLCTSWISQHHRKFHKILFHSCMYGGLRPKRTGLLANFDITSLEALCDDSHDHAPWRSFSDDSIHFHTSEEAAYPPQFCTAVTSLLADIAVQVSLSHLTIYLIFTLQTQVMQSIFFLVQLVCNLVDRNFLSFLLPSRRTGFHKQICLLFVLQIRSFSFLLSRVPRAQHKTSPDDKRKMKILIPLTPQSFLEKLNGINHPSQLDSPAWRWYPSAIKEPNKKKQDEYLRGQAEMLSSIIFQSQRAFRM